MNLNWTARTQQLLGTDAHRKLSDARVAVFGLGGVGSFVVEALARSGIGYIRLVDSDKVQVTNINRQLYALHSSVNITKVACAAQRVADINPHCVVDSREIFVNADTVEESLEPPVDIIVDAIDSVSSKVNLLYASVQKNCAVVSSMGAGGRTDPGCIRSGDIAESTICPLARIIRKRLHRKGIYSHIRCVYSVEKPRNTLPSLHQDDPATSGTGRARVPIGTISYMPALFGLHIAYEVIAMILKDTLHKDYRDLLPETG